MQNRLTRADVPVEQTWNLDGLFASPALWEAEVLALEAACDDLQPYRGRLGDGAATLQACLDAMERLQQRLSRAVAFAHLRNAQDGTDPQHQAALARAHALASRMDAGIAFVDAEILALPAGMVDGFLAIIQHRPARPPAHLGRHVGHRDQQERGDGAPAPACHHRGLPAAAAQGAAVAVHPCAADAAGRGGPHMRRYARLRRRVLGLDKLLYCDIKAPLDPDSEARIAYPDACRLFLDSLACMGPDYVQMVRTMQDQPWVDRADNIGKSSGAFCATPYGVHPLQPASGVTRWRSTTVRA